MRTSGKNEHDRPELPGLRGIVRRFDVLFLTVLIVLSQIASSSNYLCLSNLLEGGGGEGREEEKGKARERKRTRETERERERERAIIYYI